MEKPEKIILILSMIEKLRIDLNEYTGRAYEYYTDVYKGVKFYQETKR